MRKILSVLFVIVLLTFTGCSAEDKALAFISEKYGKEFKPIFFENSDYLSNTKYVHCYTEGMDPEKEYVQVGVYINNGEVKYVDNYFSYYISKEVEQCVTDIVSTEFEECKVYHGDNYRFVSNELTCKNTLDDLYEIESVYYSQVTVYVNGDTTMSEDEYSMKMQNIENKLLDSGYGYLIYIYVVSPTIYDSIDRYTQDDFLSFTIRNRTPDGNNYYYLYHNCIYRGEIL